MGCGESGWRALGAEEEEYVQCILVAFLEATPALFPVSASVLITAAATGPTGTGGATGCLGLLWSRGGLYAATL